MKLHDMLMTILKEGRNKNEDKPTEAARQIKTTGRNHESSRQSRPYFAKAKADMEAKG